MLAHLSSLRSCCALIRVFLCSGEEHNSTARPRILDREPKRFEQNVIKNTGPLHPRRRECLWADTVGKPVLLQQYPRRVESTREHHRPLKSSACARLFFCVNNRLR